MGYNLNKLKKKMGVGSASKVGYTGAQNPGDKPEQFNFKADEFVFDKGTGVEAKPNEEGRYTFDHPSEGTLVDLTKYGYDSMVLDASRDERAAQRSAYDDQVAMDKLAARAAYDKKYAPYEAQLAAAEADQAAYDAYSAEYDRRLGQTPMYADEQFTNSKQFGWTGGKDSPVARPAVYTQQDRMNDTGNWYEDVLGTPAENYLGNTDPYRRDTNSGTGRTNVNGVTTEDMGGGITRYYQADGTYSDVNTNAWRGQNYAAPSGYGINFNIPMLNQNRSNVPLNSFIDPYANLVEGEETPITYDLGDFDTSNINLNEIGFKRGGSVKGYAAGDPVTPYDSLEEQADAQLEIEQAQVIGNEGPSVTFDSMREGVDNQVSDGQEWMTQQLKALNAPVPSSYSEQLKRERTDYSNERNKFNEMVQKMADSQSKGPSESEKWFRLAAAFGSPTKTGSFFESLGLANKELAGVAKEKREATVAGQALEMQGLQFNLESLKEKLAITENLSAIEREERKGLRDLIYDHNATAEALRLSNIFDLDLEKSKREYELKQPKTEAGKQALDQGIVHGSEAYTTFMTQWYVDAKAKKELDKQILEDNFNQLNTSEITQVEKAKQSLFQAGASLTLIERAIQLNATAYTGSLVDKTGEFFAGNLRPGSQGYKDTQELEIILNDLAVQKLKLTFGGGGISNEEREALQKLQGLTARDKDTRQSILNASFLALLKVEKFQKNKRDTILNRTAYSINRPDTGGAN